MSDLHYLISSTSGKECIVRVDCDALNVERVLFDHRLLSPLAIDALVY